MNIPSLDFGLGEDINMLRDAVKAFADAEIAPRAAEIDRLNEFPADLWKKFGDMGLLGMTALVANLERTGLDAVPIIALFMYLQRYIVSGLTAGGVKG